MRKIVRQTRSMLTAFLSVLFVSLCPATVYAIDGENRSEFPRLASLKYGEVNGRVGPSEQHNILWQYQRKNLPVLLTAQSSNWFRIEDPMGGVAWVHKRLVKRAPTFQVQNDDEPAAWIHRKPNTNSTLLAQIEVGVVVKPDQCQREWCKVHVRLNNKKSLNGWIKSKYLWGAAWFGS